MTDNTETESKRKQLPIDKPLYKAGEKLENSNLVSGVDGIKFIYTEDDENPIELASVDLSSLDADVVKTLAIAGIRYFAQLAVQGADKEADETNESLSDILGQRIKDRLESIFAGTFSERGGERGANLVTVARVVAVMKNRLTVEQGIKATAETPEVAETLANLKTQQANLSIKDSPTEQGKAFGEFLKLLRTRKEYKEAARQMFPRKAGPGRKPKVATADILAGL